MEPNQLNQSNKLDQYLKTLSLHKVREIYLSEAESAARTKLSYQDYLLRIVEQQIITKMDGSVNRKMQIASFPQIKRLEEFDFSYQPKLNEKHIRELAALDTSNTAKNIIFIGAP